MRSCVLRMAVSEVEGTFALVGVYALTFTPADISLWMVGAAALITALGTAIASIMSARRVEVKVAEVKEVIQGVREEAKVIGGHVNSLMTEKIAKIEALENENRALRAESAEKREIASLLAQAAATVATATAVPANPIVIDPQRKESS